MEEIRPDRPPVRLKNAIWLAFFLLVVGILVIPARVFVGDPYAWRQEAINLILNQRLEIPPGLALDHGERNQYFTQNPRNHEWYSKYGLMSGLLNTAPLLAEYIYTGRLPPWDSYSRRFFLGLFYAGVGALFGAVLLLLCGHYGVSGAAALWFTLTAIFCTYLGYYLRATNSEAYQLLFFTAFFERVAAYRASGFRAHARLFAAWFWLLLLVHVKVSHLMVAGIFTLGLFGWEFQAGLRGRELARLAAWRLGLPMALLLATVALVNFWKFGSPVGTGYTLWQGETFEHNIPPWRAFRNLFLTLQWGVPIHFPLLLLACFGARDFWRRFPFDAWLAGMIFLAVFLVIGSMPVWRGEWAYGPRYFLFALPALSLPALLCFERFLHAEERRRPAVRAGLAAVGLLSLVSAFFQFEVARLDPFFGYWARPNIAHYHDDEISEYWNTVNFAWVAALCWHMRDRPEELWWMKRLKQELAPDVYQREVKRLETWLRRTNFYWWSPRD